MPIIGHSDALEGVFRGEPAQLVHGFADVHPPLWLVGVLDPAGQGDPC
jgi:hypothetical protein